MVPTLKDRLTAYVRVVGTLLPTAYVWRPFGGLVELDRCTADGRLVGNSPTALSRHLGHELKRPVVLSWFELLLVWVRWIK